MKRFPKEVAAAVEPALQAARDVLRDLEPDDVPASLRRIAAHSGPRLTPPLAAKLVAELDDLEWLRRDAAERLPEDAPGVARAFLERDDGWWADVADAVGEVRGRAGERKARSLEHEAARQRDALSAAKAKLKQQKLEAKGQSVGLRDEIKELKKQAAASVRAEVGDRAILERRVATLEAALAEARDDLAHSDTTLAEMRDRLHRQRRELARARRALDAGGSASVLRDPIALARELDLAAASVPRRHVVAEPEQAAARPRAARLVIPAGIRPDRAEAVEWLLERPEVTVIVDGYNLLFNIDPGEFTTGKARRGLGELMGRFTRKAKGAPQVLIVFDSTLPGSRDTKWAGPGVQVRFADADRLADEEIVLLAASTEGAVVVVSSDREVQENAAAAGAVILWSEAFVEWIREIGS